jgi:hypothetical protein
MQARNFARNMLVNFKIGLKHAAGLNDIYQRDVVLESFPGQQFS